MWLTRALLMFGGFFSNPLDHPWRYRLTAFAVIGGAFTLVIRYFPSWSSGHPKGWATAIAEGLFMGVAGTFICERLARKYDR